jgi:protein TonB
MSYLTQSQANRPAAIAGVIAVHAGLATIVLAGFAVADVVRQERTFLDVYDVKDPPPPEPQQEVPPKPKAAEAAKPLDSPTPPIKFPVPKPIERPLIDPVADYGPITLPPVNVGTGAIQAIEPARAKPRNDPGLWVTDADYRSRWIREERFGTARFRLEIAANGRVDSCTITRSTGHAVLDTATCDLITKRARFDPATDSTGARIGGVYESSIRWVLPD